MSEPNPNEPQINLEDPAIKAAIEAAVAKEADGLKKNRDQIKAEKLELQEKLKHFEGIDVEEVAALRKAKEEAEAEAARKSGDIGKILDENNRRHTEKFEKTKVEYEGKIASLESAYKNLLVDTQISGALSKAGVLPALVDAAKARLSGQVRVEPDSEGGFRAYATSNGSEVSVADFVRLWAESEEGYYFVAANMNSGGGVGPRSAGGKTSRVNPFKKETFNLSEQMKLAKEDQKLAEMLRREAGM